MKPFYPLRSLLSMAAVVVAFGPLATSFASAAQTSPSQDEIDLAVTIVNDYRQLRSSCVDMEQKQREMCYYRLKIGQWDYHEARTTLAKAGIHSKSSEMVAQSR